MGEACDQTRPAAAPRRTCSAPCSATWHTPAPQAAWKTHSAKSAAQQRVAGEAPALQVMLPSPVHPGALPGVHRTQPWAHRLAVRAVRAPCSSQGREMQSLAEPTSEATSVSRSIARGLLRRAGAGRAPAAALQGTPGRPSLLAELVLERRPLLEYEQARAQAQSPLWPSLHHAGDCWYSRCSTAATLCG